MWIDLSGFKSGEEEGSSVLVVYVQSWIIELQSWIIAREMENKQSVNSVKVKNEWVGLIAKYMG